MCLFFLVVRFLPKRPHFSSGSCPPCLPFASVQQMVRISSYKTSGGKSKFYENDELLQASIVLHPQFETDWQAVVLIAG
jgi:hypothetical protein